MDDILKLADKFEKLVAQKVESTTAQSGDIQAALEKGNLWKIDHVYAAMDAMSPPYEGKATGKLIVSPSGSVSITISGPRAGALKTALGKHLARMSKLLKKKKVLPAGKTIVPWFENTG